jgi:Protein of unknown function (DUF3037)
MTERPQPYEYCMLRFVPRVERGEFYNVGVVVICRAHRFLSARILFDEEKLAAFAPHLTTDQRDALRDALELIPRICAGDADAGPIAKLGLGERWHWVAAPASTMLQSGPVHTGLCGDPEAVMERIFAEQVGVDGQEINLP